MNNSTEVSDTLPKVGSSRTSQPVPESSQYNGRKLSRCETISHLFCAGPIFFASHFTKLLQSIYNYALNLFANCFQQNDPHRSQNILKTVTALSKDAELRAKLVKEFTPQLIEALGGYDAVAKIPEIPYLTGFIDPMSLKNPISKSYDKKGNLILRFCLYRQFEIGTWGLICDTICKKEKGWYGTENLKTDYSLACELTLGQETIPYDSPLEK